MSRSKEPEPVISPVKVPDNEAGIVSEIVEESEKYEIAIESDGEEFPHDFELKFLPVGPPTVKKKTESTNFDEISFASKKFSDDIKIDFIRSIDYRILCRFLGITTVNDIKNHPYQENPLITMILMQSVLTFMEQQEFEFVGELNFDREGNSIPPDKTVWKIKGKEVSFTTSGFLYFEKKGGEKKDNVVFFLFTDLDRAVTSVTCYTSDKKGSEKYINQLESFAKEYNCLKGLKLRDVNMLTSSFAEVEKDPKYSWDNYYFEKEVIHIFESEVFGFLDNVKKYNDNGIYKRGIITHGSPGTGKTTIGYIICNRTDKTVIWITPEILGENNFRALSSVKLLYKLADFVSPCIIILEDLDLFGEDRDLGGDHLRLGALMNVLDGVNSVSNAVTIGNTNRLQSIELALRNRPGRFDRIVEITPLCDELREKMFINRLKDWKVSDDTIKHIVNKTNDWTGAESQEFINTLNLDYINNGHKKKILTIELVNKAVATMEQFGVGTNKSFGFGETKPGD